MEWSIVPNVGVGLLKFGDTPEVVKAKLGAPYDTRTTSGMREFDSFLERFWGKTTPLEEFRSYTEDGEVKSLPTLVYDNEQLVEIIFHEDQANLNFNGVPFYSGSIEQNISRLLEMSHKIAHTDDGTYFFMDLGISMLGGIDN